MLRLGRLVELDLQFVAFVLKNEDQVAKTVSVRDVGPLVYLDSGEFPEPEQSLGALHVQILVEFLLPDWNEEVLYLASVSHVREYLFLVLLILVYVEHVKHALKLAEVFE